MDVIGIIPARYSSSRFEGKVLADVLGKPMLQHVWERAKQSIVLDDLIIACDDQRMRLPQEQAEEILEDEYEAYADMKFQEQRDRRGEDK